MFQRLAIFLEFASTFIKYAAHVREVIGSLLLLMVLGGVAISWLEGIRFGNAIYFSFVTGLTIGYGDIAPETGIGRIVSVAIGLVGTLFVGITVAVSTRALADTAKRHLDTSR